MTHEVMVLCRCEDIEHCRMEVYVADIRTLLVLYGDPLAPVPHGVLDARGMTRPQPTLPNPNVDIRTGKPV